MKSYYENKKQKETGNLSFENYISKVDLLSSLSYNKDKQSEKFYITINYPISGKFSEDKK